MFTGLLTDRYTRHKVWETTHSS